MNLANICYVGDRPSVGKEWKRKRYIFIHSTPIKVRQDLADLLLSTGDFIHAHELKKTLVENYPDGGRIMVRRWGALGDLLMFRAAFSAFARAHPGLIQPVLRCQDRFCDVFSGDPLWSGVTSQAAKRPTDVLGMATFDQVAEADHRGSEVHRVDLFLQAMTNKPLVVSPEDWDLPIDQSVTAWVNNWLTNHDLHRATRDAPLVGLQVRASTSFKTMPERIMMALLKRLLKSGYDVVTIDSDHRYIQKFQISDRVFEISGRDPLHCIEMMKHLDVCIVGDSAPLWMAHCAACPIVAVLGPTRAEQRITKHPLYPDKAVAVALNDIIECPACFERAEDCDRTYRCMLDQPDWEIVINRILEAAASVLGLSSASSDQSYYQVSIKT